MKEKNKLQNIVSYYRLIHVSATTTTSSPTTRPTITWFWQNIFSAIFADKLRFSLKTHFLPRKLVNYKNSQKRIPIRNIATLRTNHTQNKDNLKNIPPVLLSFFKNHPPSPMHLPHPPSYTHPLSPQKNSSSASNLSTP